MGARNRQPGRPRPASARPAGPGKVDLARTRGPVAVPDPAARIAADPRFRQLVRERSTFAWTLSAVMLAVYLAFILLVAFAHDLMATKLGGGTTSLGIVIGLAVIVFAFLLTGVYVRRANARFDALTRELTGEARR